MRELIYDLLSKTRWALLAAALLGAGTGIAFSNMDEGQAERPAPVRLEVDSSPAPREQVLTTSFAPVVKKVAPSVVNVFTTTKVKVSQQQVPFDDPFFRRFFGDEFGPRMNPKGGRPPQQGLGSGVIVSEDGYILTNNHVVEDADEVKVALHPDGKQYTATVVGRDPKSDVAVLKIDAKGLPHVTLGDSEKIEVGDLVLAIGNPFGLGQTVTMGMVSATGRASLGLDYEDFIQTDAAINPGNSGGALIDAAGRLVGINTAILSRSGGNQGIGFAIPVNMARDVMENLVEHGRMIRGFLGVTIQDVTEDLAKEFQLPEASGALVSDVTPGSPAAKAGVQTGDVLVELNGKPVRDSRHLKLQVGQAAPGEKIELKVRRESETKTLDVTLKEQPDSQVAGGLRSSESPAGDDALDGVVVADLDSRTRMELRLPRGVQGALVAQVAPDSASYKAGLREGDVIVEINRKPVAGAEEAVALSEKIKSKTILLRIWSGGGSRYVVVQES